jgi:hypothetical protein
MYKFLNPLTHLAIAEAEFRNTSSNYLAISETDITGCQFIGWNVLNESIKGQEVTYRAVFRLQALILFIHFWVFYDTISC